MGAARKHRVARTVCRIGLISDTHMPERCDSLPASLFAALAGVDLLLHAGDVGELWVLDRLGQVAPVVAVHGNDDTAEAQRELPYQQLVSVAGKRILLCHSHHPDLATEMASRRGDAWGPKLARWASMGQRVGASVSVFGHTHVPMARRHDGVLLVNPGAIASPNWHTRQRRQTAAILSFGPGGSVDVAHVDLANPGRPYAPAVDWEAGFKAALDDVSESLLAPDLQADFHRIVSGVRSFAPEAGREAVLRVARRCWSGQQASITRNDLLAELDSDPHLSTFVREQLATLLRGSDAS